MTREEFIKRLIEVGLIQEQKEIPDYYDIRNRIHMSVAMNKEMFMDDYKIYTFDELEQLLIDKGIIEKPFNAYEYLLFIDHYYNMGG